MRWALALVALCCGAAGERPPDASVEAEWDFDGGAEGFGNATREEQQVELWATGGMLVGRVEGPAPALDSAALRVPLSLRSWLVFRSRHSGGVDAVGAVAQLEAGSALSPLRTAHAQAAAARATAEAASSPFLIDWVPSSGQPAPVLVTKAAVDGNSTSFALHYAPLGSGEGYNASRLRLLPAVPTAGGRGPTAGQSLELDWLRFARAPLITRVTGCGGDGTYDQYFSTHEAAVAWNHTSANEEGAEAPSHTAEGTPPSPSPASRAAGRVAATRALTFNCMRRGGDRVRVEGVDFGNRVPPLVSVGGRSCADVTVVRPGSVVECTVPPGQGSRVAVRVQNGETPGLHDARPCLSYQEAVPPPRSLAASNTAAHAVSLDWAETADPWHAATVTGYVVLLCTPPVAGADCLASRDLRSLTGSDAGEFNASRIDWHAGSTRRRVRVAGNVTKVIVGDLPRATELAFHVAALVEGRASGGWRVADRDGLRPEAGTSVGPPFVLPGALVSSPTSAVHTRTLEHDFAFPEFTANASLRHGPADDRRSTDRRGVGGGEGAFGLLLTGAAHVQNGNGTHVCCDLRNRTTGLVAMPYGADADAGRDMATAHEELGTDPCALVLGADQDTGVDEQYGAYDTGADPFGDFPAQSAYPTEPSTDLSAGDTAAAEDPFRTHVGYYKVYDASGEVSGPVTALQGNGARAVAADDAGFLGSAFCGPALRLTGSEAGQVASAWYGRPQAVDEGFETQFSFRLSNPSLTCKALDNSYTHCRSRGGSGFAFVLQAAGASAVGRAGSGLGYDGIPNSLAIEFDTYYDEEQEDPYENHVSVHTRGWRYGNRAGHAFSLGEAQHVGDLTDGTFDVKVQYSPVVSPTDLEHPSFLSTAAGGRFFEGADAPGGGMPDWGTGLGALRIYLQDMDRPLLTVPVKLDSLQRLPGGRAWVGFTAATDTVVWQAHDIQSWTFRALRHAPQSEPPQLVDGWGAHECVEAGGGACMHP